MGRGWRSSYSDLLRADGPGIESRWGRHFRTRPELPWGPHSLLYNVYRISFPGVKRPGRGVHHPPPSSTEVKERVELYVYTPCWPLWSFLARTLLLYLPVKYDGGIRTSREGGIFRTHPDWPRDKPSLLYNGCRFSSPGVKWPERVCDYTPSSRAGFENG